MFELRTLRVAIFIGCLSMLLGFPGDPVMPAVAADESTINSREAEREIARRKKKLEKLIALVEEAIAQGREELKRVLSEQKNLQLDVESARKEVDALRQKRRDLLKQGEEERTALSRVSRSDRERDPFKAETIKLHREVKSLKAAESRSAKTMASTCGKSLIKPVRQEKKRPAPPRSRPVR